VVQDFARTAARRLQARLDPGLPVLPGDLFEAAG